MAGKCTKTLFTIACAVFLAQSQVTITGTISDSGSSTGIYGAIVSLAAGGATALSDSIGQYVLGGGLSQVSRSGPKVSVNGPAAVSGNQLHFCVANGPAHVRIEAFTLSGQRLGAAIDRILGNGEYSTALPGDAAASQIFLLRVRIGENVSVLKAQSIGSRQTSAIGFHRLTKTDPPKASRKTIAAADTLIAWAVGYDIAKLAINVTAGTYDMKLHRLVPQGSVQVVQTSQAGDLLAAKNVLTSTNDDGSSIPTVSLDSSLKFQAILGFGGAFTEASAYNLNKVGAQKRAQILKSYFNPYTGSGYTVCRTHLQSCDFCVAKYSYDDVAGDYDLANFSIQHETTWMIPMIKEAMTVSGADIKIFASPWSPSAWMKSNNNMLNGGTLLPACANTWALCFVKYIQAMQDNGVPIWGLTIQNEPEASQTWESCIYTAASMRDFLKNNLGPALAKNNCNVNVMIYDHNKDNIATWANTIYSDTAAAKYAWGTAFHWYTGDQFDNVRTTHDNFPKKHLLATEQADLLPMYSWTLAEKFGHDIIGDLNAWTEGWVEWNLVLDQDGLPRHDPNTGCASSVHIDFNNDSVHYNPSYYYMAHFSKYLRPGAVRIQCQSNNGSLETTAFKNTDGVITVVVLNKSANAVAFKIKLGNQIIKPTIPAHAIVDFIF
jgi:glucosylceramidase